MTASTQTHSKPQLLGGPAARVVATALSLAVGASAGFGLAWSLKPATIDGAAAAAADTSYDVAEKNRAQAVFGAADTSYDQVEKNRLGVGNGSAADPGNELRRERMLR
jgi:hypothetical protein